MRPLLKGEKVVIDRAHDLLGQGAALETLEQAIARVPAPACVAVYGPWGSGKTTLMHSAFAARPQDTVWFDPWPYERTKDIVGPLLYAVAAGPARSEERKRKLLDLAEALVKFIALVGIRVGAVSLLGGDLDKLLGRIDVGKELKQLTKSTGGGDPVALVRRRFKALVDECLADSPQGRLVVFLDDLDRCLPDSVVELIEAVKLLMCGEPDTRAVFVFAVDRHIVGEAIRQRYPGSTGFTGENYLEKIFDLALEVPPVEHGDLKQFVVNQMGSDLDRLTAPFGTSSSDGLLTALEVLGQPMFANPRVITRVLNRLDLLVASDRRRDALAAVDDPVRLRRWLLWVAGAERYRGFRYYVRRASDVELGALQRTLVGQAGELSHEGQLLADMPGFGRFVGELFRGVQIKAELTRSPAGTLATVADFDHLLRSAGL
ncbi:MAG: AAA family ATPase [Myxococcales bacterium]|nr:AAA family ATPase [Myxococcales bacterium]MCB9523642.1 AAA family ATPase [Myxococcales bacterium]